MNFHLVSDAYAHDTYQAQHMNSMSMFQHGTQSRYGHCDHTKAVYHTWYTDYRDSIDTPHTRPDQAACIQFDLLAPSTSRHQSMQALTGQTCQEHR